jgi:hypothetical protein
MGKSGWSKLTADERDQRVQVNRAARMEIVDEYDPATRALVHAYGLSIVRSFHENGVTKAKRIKHLVECVLDEFSPTRGSYSQQGVRVAIERPSHDHPPPPRLPPA